MSGVYAIIVLLQQKEGKMIQMLNTRLVELQVKLAEIAGLFFSVNTWERMEELQIETGEDVIFIVQHDGDNFLLGGFYGRDRDTNAHLEEKEWVLKSTASVAKVIKEELRMMEEVA